MGHLCIMIFNHWMNLVIIGPFILDHQPFIFQPLFFAARDDFWRQYFVFNFLSHSPLPQIRWRSDLSLMTSIWKACEELSPWSNLTRKSLIGSAVHITGLPPYHDNTVILVVVDHFSKGIHLDMFPAAHTAHAVASLFMEIVGKIHGLPQSLVSDRDPLFVSKFWQELFRRSGTQLRMSSTYHPQSDGQTEVLNRVIE